MALRPRQIKAIEDVRAAYAAGKRAPVLVAATGFGKTHTSAEIIRSAVQRGKTVWFLAHLREILDDTCKRLDSVQIVHGRIMAGAPRLLHRSVQVVSVQTAARRTDLPRPDLIIVDECHLAIASTYKKVIEAAGNPLLLGLTGTPERLDRRGLGEMFDAIVPTCSTRDLIEEGLLAPIRYYAPSRPDLGGVAVRAGDYAADELEEAMDRPTLTGDAVSHYKRACPGKRAVVFCTTVRHAEHVAAQFRAAGYRAVAISGKSAAADRKKALTGLRSGEIQVVCNAQLWVAGVDVPEIECVVLLRPTKSLTFYLQSIGRGLRTAPGKKACVVLDHAGCIFEHGPPDMQREWSLDAKRRKGKQVAPAVRECPSCFAAHEPAPVCPLCGHVYTTQERSGPEQVEGTLDAVDLEAMQRERKREQGKAQTMEQLMELGKQRGYKNPRAWAMHVVRARERGRVQAA
jgi:superfamily II DNA or RNA helicase